jgi:hypothetical protein
MLVAIPITGGPTVDGLCAERPPDGSRLPPGALRGVSDHEFWGKDLSSSRKTDTMGGSVSRPPGRVGVLEDKWEISAKAQTLMNDLGTVFVLVGPKIVKLAPDRPDNVCLPSIRVQAAAKCHRPSGITGSFRYIDPKPGIQITISSRSGASLDPA